jgi:uncharacterized protein (DUF2336 family)
MTSPADSAPEDASLAITAATYDRVKSHLGTDERAVLARHCAAVNRQDLDAAERELVTRIIRLIAADVEVSVRAALAEAVANDPTLPRDVAVALAADVDDVALPMLRASEVLEESDLVALVVRELSQTKMLAIAGRRAVPKAVAGVLAELGNADVAKRLLDNANADISETAFGRLLDRHGTDTAVQERMVARRSLPAGIVVRLVGIVADYLVTRIAERHKLPPATAESLVLETRERAALGLSSGLSAEALDNLIGELLDSGRLTDSLLLRSVCTGNFEFFCHALAAIKLASPAYLAQRLRESPKPALEEWWPHTLPRRWLPLMASAIEMMIVSEADGSKWEPAEYHRLFTQRVMSQIDKLDIVLEDSDVDFILGAPLARRSAAAV